MPKPRNNENRDDFIERCMGDSEAISSFPNSDQRFAFCNSQWSNKIKSENEIKQKSVEDGNIIRKDNN